MEFILFILFIILAIVGWVSYLIAFRFKKMLAGNEYSKLWRVLIFAISFIILGTLTLYIIGSNIRIQR